MKGDKTFRTARTCYDHLAGRLGVALADVLQRSSYVVLQDGTGLITPPGQQFLCEFGINLSPQPAHGRKGRALCRACLDGTERRSHLAGRLGAALCTRCFDLSRPLPAVPQMGVLYSPLSSQSGDWLASVGQAVQACLGWLERVSGSRAVAITREGYDGFAQTFGIKLDQAVCGGQSHVESWSTLGPR